MRPLTCHDCSYEDWMASVDAFVSQLTMGGLGVDDLADWMSRDTYEAGTDSKEGALEALRNDDMGADFLAEIGEDD